MRTPMTTPSFRLHNEEPHTEQNSFAKPSGGWYERTRFSPDVTRKEPGRIRICGDAAAPLLRWQDTVRERL